MVYALIVAAGRGVRLNDAVRKQYIPLGSRSILGNTLLAIKACDRIDEIILVVPEGDFEICENDILVPLAFQRKVHMVAGGPERQDSVYRGLLAVENKNSIVLIHDGVRPFVNAEQLAACIAEAQQSGACLLGIPAYDTLKHIDDSGYIEHTLKREKVWLAQTPQAFRYDVIIDAHENARREGFIGTDDASLVERLGGAVKVIPGSKLNIKITTREDLTLARAIFSLIQ